MFGWFKGKVVCSHAPSVTPVSNSQEHLPQVQSPPREVKRENTQDDSLEDIFRIDLDNQRPSDQPEKNAFMEMYSNDPTDFSKSIGFKAFWKEYRKNNGWLSRYMALKMAQTKYPELSVREKIQYRKAGLREEELRLEKKNAKKSACASTINPFKRLATRLRRAGVMTTGCRKKCKPVKKRKSKAKGKPCDSPFEELSENYGELNSATDEPSSHKSRQSKRSKKKSRAKAKSKLNDSFDESLPSTSLGLTELRQRRVDVDSTKEKRKAPGQKSFKKKMKTKLNRSEYI